jgi:hypothetical protein
MCEPKSFKVQQYRPDEVIRLERCREGETMPMSSICSDPAHPMIRILELQPSEDPAAPLRCRLGAFPLDRCPSYIALSYCWGMEVPIRTIFVNEVEIEIRSNLHDALRRLRKRSYPEYFWADAVCIDQHDISERNQQVKLMLEIYKRADITLIWLGEDEGDGALGVEMAHQFIRINNAMFVARDHRTIYEMNSEDYGKYGIPDPRFENPAITSYLSVLKRPWFQRAWVIQEASVSKNLMISCGRWAIPWEDFIVSTRLAEGLGFQPSQRGDGGFVSVGAARSIYHENNYERLLPLLARHRQAQATDPRDKVFALLGLLNDPSSEMQPDYGLTVKETYRQAAHSILRKDQNLDLLSIPRPLGGSRVQGLPSWIPDWSVEDLTLPLTFYLWREEENAAQIARRYDKCVTEGSRESALGVHGYIIDQITLVGPIPKRDKKSDNPNASLHDRTELLREEQHRYYAWKSIAIPQSGAKYHATGEDFRDVFWQVLVAGKIDDGYDVVKQDFEAYHEIMGK